MKSKKRANKKTPDCPKCGGATKRSHAFIVCVNPECNWIGEIKYLLCFQGEEHELTSNEKQTAN